MRHEVTIDGRTLTVERPYSRRARVLVGGTELPKDRYGNYSLPDEHGEQQRVTVGFDHRHLAPRLHIGDRRVLTVPPLPKAAWLLLAPVVVLVLIGGVLGAVLGMTAAMLSAQQLRRPDRGWSRFAAAAGIELAAIALYAMLASLIGRL